MSPPSSVRRQSDSVTFCIRAGGCFPASFSEHYTGLTLQTVSGSEGAQVNEIAGRLADQTALLSLLGFLDDHGLVLHSIESIDDPVPLGDDENQIAPGGIDP